MACSTASMPLADPILRLLASAGWCEEGCARVRRLVWNREQSAALAQPPAQEGQDLPP